MIKNHWHRRQSDHCLAQKLCLKVSTSAIHGHDLVHKAGQRHLGVAFGLTEFSALKMGRIWCTRAGNIGGLPRCDCCYSAPCSLATFILGLQHRWTFLQHTMPTAGEHMQPLKDVIRGKLITMLIKQELNNVKLEMVTVTCMLWWHVFE